MANKRITELTDIGNPNPNDILEIVDVSDTTDSPEGTSKKVKVSELGSGSQNLQEVTDELLNADGEAETTNPIRLPKVVLNNEDNSDDDLMLFNQLNSFVVEYKDGSAILAAGDTGEFQISNIDNDSGFNIKPEVGERSFLIAPETTGYETIALQSQLPVLYTSLGQQTDGSPTNKAVDDAILALNQIATTQTGNTILFDNVVGKYYNEETPISGDLTFDETNAKAGGKAVIYHSDDVEPTLLLPSGKSYSYNIRSL